MSPALADGFLTTAPPGKSLFLRIYTKELIIYMYICTDIDTYVYIHIYLHCNITYNS